MQQTERRQQRGEADPARETCTLPEFTPPWWLANRHTQTLWGAVCRRPPAVETTFERLELDDGDFLDLFWGPTRTKGAIVLLLHGLGGSADSVYVRGLSAHLAACGLQTVTLQYRGVGEPNRLPRFYHAGAYDDAGRVATLIAERYPGRALHGVGFSLGGSILLNWLAETADDCPIQRALAVSPPFDLDACATTIDQGMARVYQHDLLKGLKELYRAKYARLADPPVSVRTVDRLRSLRTFDDRVTAPLHGFANGSDYYRRCSCGPRLGSVRRPTLVLHAADDPLVPAASIPARGKDLAESVCLALYKKGGHVGFVDAAGLKPVYWAEPVIADFLLAGA